MAAERSSSTVHGTNDENDLFLDIQQEAPLFSQRKPTRIVGSIFYCLLLAGYAILAVGAIWILHSLQELIPLILCSCDVILLVVTGNVVSFLDIWEHTAECIVSFDRRRISMRNNSVILRTRLFGNHTFSPSSKRKHGQFIVFNNTKTCPEKQKVGPSLVPNIQEGIFQQYLVYQVQKIRLQGYYGFSQKLKHLIRLPFATIAYGTGAMLLIMAWKRHIIVISISLLLRIIMLVEAICAGFFMSAYIGYVRQYNSLDSQPDVLNSLYSPLQQSSSLEGMRYHDGGRLSDQQMALLQYQRENLHFLSEEILRLQECLSKYERSDDGSTPQVDLAHLLATREQELRTLSAEMNHLQSELRLARSLIAERDMEIQRFRTMNNQYVEENERVRSIMGEWSTRAAKLERALEVERMSNLELQKKIASLKSQESQEKADPTLQMDQ